MPRQFHSLPIIYWEEVRERGLSRIEIVVDIYLLTSPNSNSIGIFRESIHTIAQYVRLGTRTVEKAMKGLEAKGRLMREPGDWLFAIKRWEYEPTKSSTNWQGARDLLRRVNKSLAREFCNRYDVDWEALWRNGSRCPIDDPSMTHRRTETETKTETNVSIDENGEVSYLGERTVKDFIANPKVSDPEAIAAGCQGLPKEEPWLEKQARKLLSGELEPKPDSRSDSESEPEE